MPIVRQPATGVAGWVTTRRSRSPSGSLLGQAGVERGNRVGLGDQSGGRGQRKSSRQLPQGGHRVGVGRVLRDHRAAIGERVDETVGAVDLPSEGSWVGSRADRIRNVKIRPSKPAPAISDFSRAGRDAGPPGRRRAWLPTASRRSPRRQSHHDSQSEDFALLLRQDRQQPVHPRGGIGRRAICSGLRPARIAPAPRRWARNDSGRRAVSVGDLVRSDTVDKGQKRASLVLIARQRLMAAKQTS